MALGATVYNFDIDLADGDRGVYESLALRVARHPSESDEFLLARLLAYCLEYCDGIDTPRTASAPNASTAIAATMLESIPPDNPMTTCLKPFLRT